MKHLPGYLNIGPETYYAPRSNRDNEDYQPLLAVWLIDLSLSLGWLDSPPRAGLEGVFGSNEFIDITGLHDLEALFDRRTQDEDLDALFSDDAPAEPTRSTLPASLYMRYLGRRTQVQPSPRELRLTQPLLRKVIRAILKKGRADWLERGVNPALPLFRNIERLEQLVMLNDVEKGIIAFAAAMAEFPAFCEALSPSRISFSDIGLFRALAIVTGRDADAIQTALRRDGTLRCSGLIEIDHDEEPLPRKISLVRELRGVILNPMANDEELSQRVLHAAPLGTLSLEDFPHLKNDTTLMMRYLKGAMERGSQGLNILLYGPPGTGKTEYAKALVRALGWRLYEIAHADSDGDPLNPRMRLQSLSFSQRALRKQSDAALLFDEVEDIFPGTGSQAFAQMLGLPRRDSINTLNAKAWVNRALEDNHVPTIWITNDAQIDPAYLRRFDYSVEMGIPPHSVRRQIVQKLVGDQVADPAALDALADLNDLLPAQLERAVKVVSLADLPEETERWAGVVQTLERSRALLGQNRRPIVAANVLPYRLDYLNADIDLQTVADGLRRTGRGSLCMYGPPGTGKSAYGQWLARTLNRPLLVKRVSDLMSKWVGGNERNIARAFAEAEQEGAVLLLDEVDSFLQERRTARVQWETTLVNEMLTQMESYRGIFIASTNLMDNLDAASLRRFDLKIRFAYLKPDQSVELLHDYTRWLHLDEPESADEHAVRKLKNLTPGDFAAVCRQHQLRRIDTAKDLVQALEKESELKQDGRQAPTIGFLA